MWPNRGWFGGEFVKPQSDIPSWEAATFRFFALLAPRMAEWPQRGATRALFYHVANTFNFVRLSFSKYDTNERVIISLYSHSFTVFKVMLCRCIDFDFQSTQLFCLVHVTWLDLDCRYFNTKTCNIVWVSLSFRSCWILMAIPNFHSFWRGLSIGPAILQRRKWGYDGMEGWGIQNNEKTSKYFSVNTGYVEYRYKVQTISSLILHAPKENDHMSFFCMKGMIWHHCMGAFLMPMDSTCTHIQKSQLVNAK